MKGLEAVYSAGDFRSKDCIELLKEADIVCTNPPFSLFREYIAQLIEYNKKFIIIGNIAAIGCKEIFPLFKDNKIWLGASTSPHPTDDRKKCNSVMKFCVSGNYEAYNKRSSSFREDENGNKYVKVGNIRWFTNLPVKCKKRYLDTRAVYYTPEKYPKYDNYNAINVDKTADIPLDYPGIMGVPLTFMDKYDPEQFEILGISGAHLTCSLNLNKDYSKYIGYHKDGSKNGRTGSTFGNCPTLLKNDLKDVKQDYYKNGNQIVQPTYTRIFIKNLHPEQSCERIENK